MKTVYKVVPHSEGDWAVTQQDFAEVTCKESAQREFLPLSPEVVLIGSLDECQRYYDRIITQPAKESIEPKYEHKYYLTSTPAQSGSGLTFFVIVVAIGLSISTLIISLHKLLG